MTAPAATPATAVAATDSGGGCTIARGGAPDLGLPLLALRALASLLARRA